MGLEIIPSTIKEANRVVGRWHRHCRPVHGALFAVAVERDGSVVGVAIVGRPARGAQDGRTCEIVRVATDGTYNACSKLYGACCRAAKSLGYRRVLTKTLESESGASLRAAGFVEAGAIKAGADWDRPNGRRRIAVDMFGHEMTPTEAKVRWERTL